MIPRGEEYADPAEPFGSRSAEAVSLYLHIPFCDAKCDYCDFYSIPLGHKSPKDKDRIINRYITAVLKETERRLGNHRVPTVYIGGGSPSSLGAAGMTRLLRGLGSLMPPAGELTVEANPETADGAFLDACGSGGVTRLSLGVQSFDRRALKALGRRGGWQDLPHRVAAAAEVFGPGLSLDMMSGIPGQTEAELRRDIDRALSYNPGHISFYALTVEPGTPLARRAAGGLTLLPPDTADRLWLAGRRALIRGGYGHYEVSNFALPGRRGAHNIRYWRMENWIGVGAGASGTCIGSHGRGRRIHYGPDAETFITGPVEIVEPLDRSTVLREILLMGYRYIEGPDPALFRKRFGRTIEEVIPKTLAKWNDTEKRLLFLNSFLLDSFMELDHSKF
ncbi:MAG: coproporphyrinogen III oxidase family protein [Spirochaetaceae bacterium]|nr:coproporphyrinogen III oxidase family protein [Spirochaetaceae bacterium]